MRIKNKRPSKICRYFAEQRIFVAKVDLRRRISAHILVYFSPLVNYSQIYQVDTIPFEYTKEYTLYCSKSSKFSHM